VSRDILKEDPFSFFGQTRLFRQNKRKTTSYFSLFTLTFTRRYGIVRSSADLDGQRSKSLRRNESAALPCPTVLSYPHRQLTTPLPLPPLHPSYQYHSRPLISDDSILSSRSSNSYPSLRLISQQCMSSNLTDPSLPAAHSSSSAAES
jgi:hypothetical protein